MLKGKTALITGASRGIGRGIAVKFAKNGAFVGINYISNEKGAKETLKIIKEKGGDGILLRGDVSKPKDVENIVKTFIDKANKVLDGSRCILVEQIYYYYTFGSLHYCL